MQAASPVIESGAVDMKTVIAKQSFKSVSAKQVELNAALADRLGKKRPTAEFALPVYDLADFAELTENHKPVLLTCLNNAIAQLAKDKFAGNPVDWAWVPDAEKDLNLAELAKSFESASRGRVLTLESAGKLAQWLTLHMASLVAGIQKVEPGYMPTQAQAIIGVVSKYTAYEAKGAEFLAKIMLRLEQIAEAIANDDALAEAFSETPELANVYDALIRRFTKSAEDEISEDAL